MSLAALERAARPHHLAVFGTCPAVTDDAIGTGTLALLGPREPGFWTHVTASPAFADGAPDPLDRWSAEVISGIARDLGARALFPFGEPVRPFIAWALRSGRAWVSPVGLLVHDRAGLMVSYRGAVLFDHRIDATNAAPSPCQTCATRPCLAACPVGALSGDGYQLDACHGFLDTGAGADCMSEGCAVRRACPVSQSYGRLPVQSAHHMARFHP